jgi:inositol 1,4,5-triphosphate receptor type 1/inositol 1,4,5-triphosphate receptor type 3
VDSDGVKKNSSFNILSMTTFEIRRLFKVMDKEASIIVLSLTDFLNEVVALPCYENQLSLCETTFFEDLCYMGGFFTDAANLKARGFDNQESTKRLF